ncbi:MAG: hypothetical protein PVH68_01105 [Armatimonadota bacterium]
MRDTSRRAVARRVLCLVVLLSAGVASGVLGQGEELSGPEILSRALDLRKGITDFSAHFAIHLEIEALDLPDSSGTVYFKRPDKLTVKPERGFVVLPRDAVMPTRISKAIAEGADVTLMGRRATEAGSVYGLKITPREDGGGLRLIAWVNGKSWTMQKMEVWRDDRRAMSLTWEHTLVEKRFWLPKSVKCELAQRPRGGGRRMKGTAAITFSEYRVNTGLDDTLFDEPGEER